MFKPERIFALLLVSLSLPAFAGDDASHSRGDHRVFHVGERVILFGPDINGDNRAFDGTVDGIFPDGDVSFKFDSDSHEYKKHPSDLAKLSGCDVARNCVNDPVIVHEKDKDGKIQNFTGIVKGILPEGKLIFQWDADGKEYRASLEDVAKTRGCTIDNYCVNDKIIVSDIGSDGKPGMFNGTISAVLPNLVIYKWENGQNYASTTDKIAKTDCSVDTQHPPSVIGDSRERKPDHDHDRDDRDDHHDHNNGRAQ